MPCLRCAHAGPPPIAGTVISPRRGDECAPGALLGAAQTLAATSPAVEMGNEERGGVFISCLFEL